MKVKSAKLFVSSLFIVLGGFSLATANPFAAQIGKAKPAAKKNKTGERLLYKGYALAGEGKIAFVQYGGGQHIIQKGDKIKNLKIIDIKDEYIMYKLKGKIYRAPIEVGGK